MASVTAAIAATACTQMCCLQTGKQAHLDQAAALITDVHNTLGKTRDGNHRLGHATDDHPTLGGLRIGKADPEGMAQADQLQGFCYQ